MSDFKKGDKLLIRTDLANKDYKSSSSINCYFAHEMNKFMGQVVTVKRCYSNGIFKIKGNETRWSFIDTFVACKVKDADEEYPEIKPYNFYVVCEVVCEDSNEYEYFTKGNVYQVIDGKLIDDKNNRWPLHCEQKIKDIQYLNDYANSNVEVGTRNKVSNLCSNTMIFRYATLAEVIGNPSIIIDAEFTEKPRKNFAKTSQVPQDIHQHPIIQQFESIFHDAFKKGGKKS